MKHTVFKKDLYSMSGFDAKPIFQRELIKMWRNAVFNSPLRKIQFSGELYSMSGFNAKPVFQQDLVKMCRKAVINSPWRKIQFSPFLAKNAFCIKSPHGIQVFAENFVCFILD